MRASPGAEKLHSALHPEKPWSPVIGRGFNSRHLHQCGPLPRCSVLERTPDLHKHADQAFFVLRTQLVMSRRITPEKLSHGCHRSGCGGPDPERSYSLRANKGGHVAAPAKLPRGVTRYRDRYRVRVDDEGQTHALGMFDTLTDARAALDITCGQIARGLFVPPAERTAARRAEAAKAEAQSVTLS